MKILLTFIFCLNYLYASELVLNKSQAKKLGFQPVKYSSVLLPSKPIHEDLEWPFEKPYKQGFLANNFQQYQPYSPHPGYHGGLDMILEKNSWAVAPVSGRVEAGHYSYVKQANGQHEKQWIPWPKKGPALYFEVAVIDENGTRFELHHIDRNSLPSNIVQGLNSGSIEVKAGDRLGRVVTWGTWFHYHHVHLNVILPDGTALNPESFFKKLPDNIAPSVEFYALYQSGKSVKIEESAKITANGLQAIIASGHDKKNDNKWKHCLQKLEVVYADDSKENINFAHSHFKDGSWLDIRQIYPASFKLPSGKKLSQPTSYYPNTGTEFNLKLEMKSVRQGFTVLKASDAAGNSSSLTFSII